METLQTPKADQFAEARNEYGGDTVTAVAYHAGKVDEYRTEHVPVTEEYAGPTPGAEAAPVHVVDRVAAEVDGHWSGYQQGVYAEGHGGRSPVEVARAAVEAAQHQQPPVDGTSAQHSGGSS